MIDKQLLKLMGKNGRLIAPVVTLNIIVMLSNIGITAAICIALNLLFDGAQLNSYLYPLIIALVSIIVRYIASVSLNNLKDILGRNVKKDLRMRTYDKILKLGVKSTDGISMAGLTQMSMEGIEQLDLYYSSYLPQLFFSMISPLILFAICVNIDWRTSLVLLACVPLIPISIIAVSKYAKKVFAKYWGKYTTMGDGFLDSVQGLKELKIFQADAMRHKKMDANAEEFRKITMKVLVMQLASTTIMDLVAYGGAGAGIALALVSLNSGYITAFQALFLVLVAVEFFLPLRALGSAFHIAMNGVGAGKKIIKLLQQPLPKWGDKTPQQESVLSLSNVCFSYDGQRKILDNVSMDFAYHGMTAIVGESGCGKSTVVNLLLGAIRADSGNVTLGNQNLVDLSQKQYYAQLASVSYNTYIFNDTIRNNFVLANPAVDDKQMWEALKAVNLDKFVRDNGGLDKMISEDASDLSGGQKQRLALAVNLVADKQIYIFDEATSNIDIESEGIIMDAVRQMSKHKCVIVISHRLANIVQADKIYFMENGRVKEQGTHEQLMRYNCGYANLYKAQSELEKGYLVGINTLSEAN